MVTDETRCPICDATVTVWHVVGVRVRDIRVCQGRTQGELAEKAGLHKNFLSGLERGVRNPSLSTVLRLARAFGVDAAILIVHLTVVSGLHYRDARPPPPPSSAPPPAESGILHVR